MVVLPGLTMVKLTLVLLRDAFEWFVAGYFERC